MRTRGMLHCVALAAVAWVVSPAASMAQSADLAARLDEATLAAVRTVLESAARDSLPLPSLESKILEGVAKGVPPERIGSVVAQLAAELGAARSSLRERLPGQPLRDGEVVATAMAARHGIGYDVVETLWSERGAEGSLEVPLTVLGELVRRGVPVEEAALLMSHVVRTAVPLPVAAQIPGKLDGAMGAGRPPGQALVEALRTLNIPGPPGRRPNR